MFFRSKPKQREKDEHERFQYESAIKKVYEPGYVSLAIARMSYWEGCGVRGFGSGRVLQTPDDFRMNGVLHERTYFDKRVTCDLTFEDYNRNDGSIGACSLTHLTSDEKERIERRALSFSVSIYDPEKEWRYKAYSTLRDAAISGAQFCHFTIYVDKLDPMDVLREVRAKGYGPPLRVHGFSMSPEIILAKAPIWGWKRDFE
jgi:hypothetical protein